jgi:hypothetical protein
MVGTGIALLCEILMLAIFQNQSSRPADSAAVFFLFLHIGL